MLDYYGVALAGADDPLAAILLDEKQYDEALRTLDVPADADVESMVLAAQALIQPLDVVDFPGLAARLTRKPAPELRCWLPGPSGPW